MRLKLEILGSVWKHLAYLSIMPDLLPRDSQRKCTVPQPPKPTVLKDFCMSINLKKFFLVIIPKEIIKRKRMYDGLYQSGKKTSA